MSDPRERTIFLAAVELEGFLPGPIRADIGSLSGAALDSIGPDRNDLATSLRRRRTWGEFP